MRLLNVETLTFTTFHPSQLPSYAIASHRWIEGTEVSLEEVQEKQQTDKAGYRKLQGFVKYMTAHVPLVKWLWIDTCCIDQKSSQEVSEAINSMFQWYRRAEMCLAWLEDVATPDSITDFKNSVWFRRGWTLQELLAPSVVVFLSRDWRVIGHKGYSGHGRTGIALQTGTSLERAIAEITNIPEKVLHNYEHGSVLSVQEKMSWMVDRKTAKEEDESYCLLGILDVKMNIRYGDGRKETRSRLMEKLRKRDIQLPSTTSDQYRVPFDLRSMPTTDHFVPREADMQHLTSYFFPLLTSSAGRQRVFVVYGIGGMGKTQLCVDFARTYKDKFSAVFWLNGASKDELCRAMAEAFVRLPGGKQDLTEEVTGTRQETSRMTEKLLRWLSLPDNKEWLVIIDNVDRE